MTIDSRGCEARALVLRGQTTFFQFSLWWWKRVWYTTIRHFLQRIARFGLGNSLHKTANGSVPDLFLPSQRKWKKVVWLHETTWAMIYDSQFHALVNHVPVLLIMWHDSSATSLLKHFHPEKRARDDSGGLLDPSGPSCSKISLPTIETANVEVRAVCELQDTPSRNPYHVPFAMLECILWLPKKM